MTGDGIMEAMNPLGLVDAHRRGVDAVAAELGVDPAVGLASAEAARRAAAVGSNELERHEPTSVWRLVVGAATEPFILLLGAAALGAILLGEVRDGLLILVGLVPIVGADVATEFRGERALEALRSASAPRARVRRDGTVANLAAAGLVPGDVVVLRAGDVIPADLRLSRADRLSIDRSVLTGESVPEPGRAEPDPADAGVPDRRAIGYAGTSVVGGRGEGIVVAIGGATEMGRIAESIGERRRRRSPVQFELDRLVRILLAAAIALIAIVTTLGFVRGRSLGENLLAGISAAIAAIPEEPPILLAVILGLGAYRLLRRGVLVRRLNAEEVLGAIDLIVTDKTGTLTQNRLEVAMIADLDGEIREPERRRELLVSALRAEEDAWARADGVPPDSFTTCLERAVEAAGGVSDLDHSELVEAEPVSDERPYAMTTSRRDGHVEHLAIGAPEAVFGLLDVDAAAAPWRSMVEDAAGRGVRVVALARRGDGETWRIAALVGFADPARPGIADALGEAVGAGIQTLVVTGDHPATARAIASAAGIPADRIVTGSEVDAWTDERLRGELADLHVVARSAPEQKDRIVRVAREAGRMVAVTGDGVNDAPALHRADVAVAMGSGTAVAREAADLVLGDDSFATLMYGLREGRRIVDNVQKGLVFLISTHVAFLGFILIATLAGFDQPLLPIQILWMELFIDASASFAFEREPAEPDVMRRPPRKHGSPLLPWPLLLRLTGAGAFSAVAALWLMLNTGGSAEHAAWVAYTALVAAQVVRAYANRSLRTPVVRLSRNGLLLAGGIAVLVIQYAMPFIPGVAESFRATVLQPGEWVLVAAIALAPAVVAELVRATRRTAWVA
ncbi:MAG TPA: HAD-IC family P-type ATPase [Candidatus Deferrimicrobiaceae bacterium]|nr:HAD-IC family P-type ATPase [Candidatus Deferrimicrobiaceae bacterium]